MAVGTRLALRDEPHRGQHTTGIIGSLSTLGAVRAARYDLAVDLPGLWKSAAWARLSVARRVIGYQRAFRREPASSLLLREHQRLPPALALPLLAALLYARGRFLPWSSRHGEPPKRSIPTPEGGALASLSRDLHPPRTSLGAASVSRVEYKLYLVPGTVKLIEQ